LPPLQNVGLIEAIVLSVGWAHWAVIKKLAPLLMRHLESVTWKC
jgi:hypothetical protein